MGIDFEDYRISYSRCLFRSDQSDCFIQEYVGSVEMRLQGPRASIASDSSKHTNRLLRHIAPFGIQCHYAYWQSDLVLLTRHWDMQYEQFPYRVANRWNRNLTRDVHHGLWHANSLWMDNRPRSTMGGDSLLEFCDFRKTVLLPTWQPNCSLPRSASRASLPHQTLRACVPPLHLHLCFLPSAHNGPQPCRQANGPAPLRHGPSLPAKQPVFSLCPRLTAQPPGCWLRCGTPLRNSLPRSHHAQDPARQPASSPSRKMTAVASSNFMRV